MSGSLHDSSALIEKPEELTPSKKRKQSAAEELANFKKSRNDTRNALSLNAIINRGIPHVAELIFESIDTPELLSCMEVSETWKELMAKYVLMQRWKGKMFEACKNGQTKVVQLLLEFYNSEESGLNRRDFFGRTTLMIACKNGHTDVVQLLLDNSEGDIDLNTRTYLGWTALMYACSSGQKDIVQLLLDKRNIDLNAMNHFGGTALIIACENGDKDIVQLLLNNSYMNIDLNARDDTGKTALMWTYQKGCKDVVKLLVLERRGCGERGSRRAKRANRRQASQKSPKATHFGDALRVPYFRYCKPRLKS